MAERNMMSFNIHTVTRACLEALAWYNHKTMTAQVEYLINSTYQRMCADHPGWDKYQDRPGPKTKKENDDNEA